MLARVVLRAALVTAVIAAGGPRMSEAQLSQTAFGQSSVFVVSPLNVAPDATVTVQQPGEKSPGLAGILSFFLPFGTGSFYAGNNGHGIRHLVIGGATVVGLGVSVASLLYAADPEPPAAQILFGVSALGYLANWVWGTITAVSDANAYNRRLAGASLDPAILVLEPVPSSVGMAPAVGLRIARVTF